jgi:hypothetical protein
VIKVYKKGVKEQLSKNFVSTEFDCHGDNCCTETKIDEQLVNYLQQIRDHFGSAIDISSGFRCESHNATVSKAKASKHISGSAADFKVRGVAHDEVAKYAESIGIKGIGLYYWGCHIDTRTTKYFWLTADEIPVDTFGSLDPESPEVDTEEDGTLFMKYNETNKPLVCMQTQSTCYKGTRTMQPKGVLWHSTGANNPYLSRYVQPSDKKSAEDTYTKEEWQKLLGKNKYGNDWNHTEVQAGLNCWIGKLTDGTVTTIQTMPWNYRPWGCASGSNGSCNNGWVQFEICEDSLADKNYFNAAYKEACEITAYICRLYNIDPKGTVDYNGLNVPTILCHQDSYKLKLGSNHGDVYHWFKKYGKTMDDVRNDVAKLLSNSDNTNGTVTTPESAEVVKEYKVIVDIPTYHTAADALAKTNTKGTYEAGVYYIYSKYPDGVSGMLNISKDTTGKTAGAWINPSENVIKDEKEPVKEELQKLYRVRTAWNDEKSQKGAFASLANAKECCQKAGEGYKVFDWEGREVYAYIAPEVTEQPTYDKDNEDVTTSTKAVYDLNYPQKHLIIDPAVGEVLDEALCTKAIVAIMKNNPDFDAEIAKAFFSLACKYKIDPMMVVAQSILETGWFKFAGSSVKPEQHNYCGLGATGGGISGASFDTIEDGVRAQLQHLYAYGCKEELPTDELLVDPRFKYVTRGIAPYWEQLAGRWAVPGFDGSDAEASMLAGTTYGQKIARICEQLLATEIFAEDIDKYFCKNEPEIEDEILPEPDESERIDTEKVNIVLSLLEKLLKMLITLFSRKTN